MPTISRSKLKKRLWKIISEYIRRKFADHAGYTTCVTCGTTKHWKELQAGHWIPQAKGDAVRYEEENIHPQCFRCNVNLSGNAGEYYKYMLSMYGLEGMDRLVEQSNQVKKFTVNDLLEIEKDYKERLSELP